MNSDVTASAFQRQTVKTQNVQYLVQRRKLEEMPTCKPGNPGSRDFNLSCCTSDLGSRDLEKHFQLLEVIIIKTSNIR